MQEIETERLVLRPMTPEDADVLLDLLTEPGEIEGDVDPDARRTAESWFRRNRKHVHLYGYGARAVVSKGSGRTVGYVELRWQPDVAGCGEVVLFYGLLAPYRRRGLATEAARACIEDAFGRLGIRRIVSPIAPADAAPRRVAEKIGMHLEKEFTHEGRPMCLYAIQHDAGMPGSSTVRTTVSPPCLAGFRLSR